MRAPEPDAAVTVNGTPRPCAGASLEDLVVGLGIDPARRGVAVALNERVVPRADWATVRVAAGDRVEIVRPLAGG